MNILVDFDDSFTFNVKQFFLDSSIELVVINWKEVRSAYNQNINLIVLGPGPGHPSEYESLFPFLKVMIEKDVEVFGVCLGHQILMSLIGFQVKRLEKPIHGRTREIKLSSVFKNLFSNNKVIAQFYNSLYVVPNNNEKFIKNCIIQNNEILAYKFRNIFSTQFHIESIGTSHCSNLLKNLY